MEQLNTVEILYYNGKMISPKSLTGQEKGRFLTNCPIQLLGNNLDHIGIKSNPFCTLCNLHENMDKRQCYAVLSSTIQWEQYWEARRKMLTDLYVV